MFQLFARFPSINTEQLADKLNVNSILLDVRTPPEYSKGHIHSAKNVPLSKISEYTEPFEKEIYVICQSGIRSKKAAALLKKRGYSVINVRGGMSRWNGKTKKGGSQ